MLFFAVHCLTLYGQKPELLLRVYISEYCNHSVTEAVCHALEGAIQRQFETIDFSHRVLIEFDIRSLSESKITVSDEGQYDLSVYIMQSSTRESPAESGTLTLSKLANKASMSLYICVCCVVYCFCFCCCCCSPFSILVSFVCLLRRRDEQKTGC